MPWRAGVLPAAVAKMTALHSCRLWVLFGNNDAGCNGTATAVDLIPKDIVICDGHYEKRNEYLSVRYFQEIRKGGKFRHGSKTGTGASPEPVFWVVVEGWLGGESPFLNHAKIPAARPLVTPPPAGHNVGGSSSGQTEWPCPSDPVTA